MSMSGSQTDLDKSNVSNGPGDDDGSVSQLHKKQQQQHQQQQQQGNSNRNRSNDRGGRNNYKVKHQNNSGGPKTNHKDHMMGGNMNSLMGDYNRNIPLFGAPTLDLQVKERTEESMKFTGRCRLFVANLHSTVTEESLRKLFEQFGEVAEVYLGKGNTFAFIKMDTRQHAEAARTALDYKTYENKTLRVRLAAHAAALRVKNLSPMVTNELLEYGFGFFGEVERAIVITDDRGRSIGEGIVEFARKSSAQQALKKITNECFMLTSIPKPVFVEPFEQRDEDEGFSEKHINKHSSEYRQEREVGPRFAEPGTFEYEYAMRWKQLHDVEKQKRDRLDVEVQESRNLLQEQLEYTRLEHETKILRERLRQMEERSQQLVQIRDDRMQDDRRRDEERHRQEILIRQQEEEILRRNQVQDFNALRRQENELRMQANALQELLDRQEAALRSMSSGGNNEIFQNRGPIGTGLNDSVSSQASALQSPAALQQHLQAIQGNLGLCSLVVLLLMGIIFSGTSGRFSSSNRNSGQSKDSDLVDDGEERSAKSSDITVDDEYEASSHPRHISNQYKLLKQLSEALKFPSLSSSSESTSEKNANCHHLQTNKNHYDHHYHFHHHHHIKNNPGANFLKRVMLKNASITCNDGTTAGYYIRQSHGSRRWIIFLEGGWYCFSAISCHQRWLNMRNLMTSAHWAEVRTASGILSANPNENPYWWNANHVLIPYCSSDSWSGDSPAKLPGDLSFLGSRIIEQVIVELLPMGLFEARNLLLAGSSAGAAGVLVNLDRVADMLQTLGSKVDVKGLSDSGWFLDNDPFDFHTASTETSSSMPPPRKLQNTSCLDPSSCPPIAAVKQGFKLWNGQVPSACHAKYESEPWRCYFGYRIYPTLKTPLFVFQWLYDEAQMTVNNVGVPVTKAQWHYIHKLGQQIKLTLENVTAVFAPSCISHIILTKRDWSNIKIKGISLPQAIRCWEIQATGLNYHDLDLFLPKNKTEILPESPVQQLFKFTSKSEQAVKGPVMHQVRLVEKVRKKKKRRKHRRRHQVSRLTRTTKSSQTDTRYRNERHRWMLHNDVCNYHLIDSCSWPQCSRSCPRLHNPFTGEEVDFIQLLKSFGLDMNSMAKALGIDQQTLHDMDHDTLLQLLTQQ